MRMFRTILGMLLLAVGVPALLAGGVLWTAMQHRDPGGAFSGELQRMAVPGYAVVVPDIDRLLRADAPFARVGDTQLRIAAATTGGPAFVGLAPAAEIDRYLSGVPHTRVDAVDLGTGALPVTSARILGPGAPADIPGRQAFWARTGLGELSLVPGAIHGGPYSLVVMSPGAAPVNRLAAVAEVRPSWLNSSTWGLLTLGTLLVMAGVVALVWPGRRREVVYVVEPSQVPELMHAIGAPLPTPAGVRQGGAHRPRTLADSRPIRPPALPEFSWPPKTGDATAASRALQPSPTADPSAARPSAAGPSAAGPSAAGSAVAGSSVAGSSVAGSSVAGSSAAGSSVAGSAAGQRAAGSGVVGSAGAGSGGVAATADDSGVVASVPGGSGSAAVGPGDVVAGAGSHTPAPGRPLDLLGEPPTLSGMRPGAVPARRTGRRAPAPSDIPEFHATAVGAWVAATAPERARQTEARAAARLREAAARKAAAESARSLPGQPTPKDQTSGVRSDAPTIAAQRTAALAEPAAVPPAAAEPAAVPPVVAEPATPDPAAAAPEAFAPAAAEPATLAPAVAEPATPDPAAAAPAALAPTAAEPATVDSAVGRVALHTGPSATDWTAVGVTRLSPAPHPTKGSEEATGPEEPEKSGYPRSRASANVEQDGRSEIRAEAPQEVHDGPAPATHAGKVGPAPGTDDDGAGSAPETGEAEEAAEAGKAEADPATGSGKDGAATVPVQAKGKGTARANNPLARAQGRISGKPANAAPGRPGPARRAPTAWIKAAESMAARAAIMPAEPEPATGSTEAGALTKPAGPEAATKAIAEPEPATKSTELGGETQPAGPEAATKASAAPEPATKSTETEGGTQPAEPEAATKSTGPGAATKSAEPQAATGSAEPGIATRSARSEGAVTATEPMQRAVAGEPTGPEVTTELTKRKARAEPDAEPAPGTTTRGGRTAARSPAAGSAPSAAQKARPQVSDAARKGAGKTARRVRNTDKDDEEDADKAGRALSYREEAAELLAGPPERRRRRTVAGRPANQDRPDE